MKGTKVDVKRLGKKCTSVTKVNDIFWSREVVLKIEMERSEKRLIRFRQHCSWLEKMERKGFPE